MAPHKADSGKQFPEDIIGFVGTGIMGSPMAQNLLRAGYKVTVYDVRPEATTDVLELGGRLARKNSELALCKIVFVIVNTAAQVHDVVLGNSGLIEGLRDGYPLKVIVMSTVSPSFIRKLAREVGVKNVTIIDAPVSGGGAAAQEGTLTFMVGGEEDALTAIMPYLNVMGKNVFHIGPLGCGVAMKLVNNTLAITNQFLVPEALRLGLKGGLDVETMVKVLQVSTGNTWFTDKWASYVGYLKMLMHDEKSHEVLNSIAVKDIESAIQWAEDMGYDPPILRAIFPMIEVGAKVTGLVSKELFDEMVKAGV